MATIDEMLRALESPSEEKISPSEFWERLGKGDDWNDMNFDSEEEFKQFMENNPYSDI